MKQDPARRIPATERRESILAAASIEFGIRGYGGATTNQIARRAGISQPYVMRMFGTKEALFLEAFRNAFQYLTLAIREAISESLAAGDDRDEMGDRLRSAYVGLIDGRGILQLLMRGPAEIPGSVIGETARAALLQIYAILRDDGHLDPERIRRLLADGALVSHITTLRIVDECRTSEEALDLLSLTFQGHSRSLPSQDGTAAPSQEPSPTSLRTADRDSR